MKTRLVPLRIALCAVLLCALHGPAFPAAVAEEPTLEGHWEGAIDVPGQKLAVEIDLSLEEGAWKGTISIPAQQAYGLPLERIRLEGRQATFAITGVPGDPTFSGSLGEDGKSLAGDFTQGGQTFPFSLTSGIDRAARASKALEGLKEIINPALEDWKTPGLALSVVVGGKTVLAEGYGHRDLEKKLPVTASTLFAIGSATKAFTTFVLGQLVDEGKVEWDEPVVRYLPNFRLHDEYASAHLTPRDMVTHRSGLPRHDLTWYNNQEIARADLVERLRHLQPNKELREQWQYNNLMYLTAGYLIEQVTEGTWEEAVRKGILEPLGMTRTNFSVFDSQKDADHALPYLEEDDEVRKVDFRPIGVMGPAGSINSSVEELARWMQVHLSLGRYGDREIISPATLKELHTPQMVIPGLPDEPEDSPASYALGWFADTWRGHYRVHHGGNIDGFSALVTLFPNDGTGIAVLVNKDASALPGVVTKVVADRVLDLEPKEWIVEAAEERDKAKEFTKKGEAKKDLFRVKGTKPSRELKEYAGEYEHPGYGRVEIQEDSGRLVMLYNRMTMLLDHWHYDVFNVAERKEEIVPEDLRVSFLTDERGRLSKLTVPLDPLVEPIVFTRLPDRRLKDPEFLSGLTGDYEIPGQVLTVSLKGNVLVIQASGQPALELEPSGSDEFAIKELTGFSIKFQLDETGRATAALIIEPSGVFEAKRVESGEK